MGSLRRLGLRTKASFQATVTAQATHVLKTVGVRPAAQPEHFGLQRVRRQFGCNRLLADETFKLSDSRGEVRACDR